MPELKRADPMRIDDYFNPDRSSSLAGYNWQLIAEGDSWYSMTDSRLWNQNLLEHLYFSQRSMIVNAAQPGDTANAMFTRNEPFKKALQGQWWLGILISASGNDLIKALNMTPRDSPNGPYRPVEQRLLRTPEETHYSHLPADYMSEQGFDRLTDDLRHWFGMLVQWRDAASSSTTRRPIFMHDYSIPVPRPAGVPTRPGGWLHSALTLYGIPADLHKGITNIVFGKLRGFLMSLDCDLKGANALPAFHVFDSAAVHLESAVTALGPSGDWVNEIHLTTAGAEKIGRAFSLFIENRLARYAMPARAG